MQTFSLAFGLMVKTNESLELSMWNLVWKRYALTYHISIIVCKRTFTNLMVVWNFEVMSDKFNIRVCRTCTCNQFITEVKLSQQQRHW